MYSMDSAPISIVSPSWPKGRGFASLPECGWSRSRRSDAAAIRRNVDSPLRLWDLRLTVGLNSPRAPSPSLSFLQPNLHTHLILVLECLWPQGIEGSLKPHQAQLQTHACLRDLPPGFQSGYKSHD